MEVPSSVMEQGRRNEKLSVPSVVSEVSLGRSIHHFTSSSPLRMINSFDSMSLLLKLNAS